MSDFSVNYGDNPPITFEFPATFDTASYTFTLEVSYKSEFNSYGTVAQTYSVGSGLTVASATEVVWQPTQAQVREWAIGSKTVFYDLTYVAAGDIRISKTGYITVEQGL